MPNTVYIIGHKNPDTDSIAAAVGYADLKRRTDMPQATPARLGDAWPETRYLLERFEVPEPTLVTDVYTRVGDVMNAHPQYLPTDATMRDAGAVIGEKRIVPIVDADCRLAGVVTLDDIAARYLQEHDLASGAQSRITVRSMVRTLDGELLAGDPEGDWRGRVWVGAMRTESMVTLVQPGDMVVLGDRERPQNAAIELGVGCIVVVGGIAPSAETIDLARARNVRLISTPHDSYRVTRLLNLSVPVSEIMRRDAAYADLDDLAQEAEETLSGRETVALPVVDADRRLVGIVSRGDLLRARGKGVILVDHNHSTQAVDGLEEAQLLEVIDHHNLGDLHTPEPIYMKLEPVGSTSTIVAELYKDAELEPSPPIAGLLAGGVVSDTLLFRSPTSTPRDRAAGAWLARLAGINLDELAQGMFRANSNYENTTPQKLFASNLKVFEWGGHRVGIGQAETVDIAYFEQHAEDFCAEMTRLKQTEGWDYSFFLATDILKQSSQMLIPGDEERALAFRAFGINATDGIVELPGVVSRKKQVVPPLARELT